MDDSGTIVAEPFSSSSWDCNGASFDFGDSDAIEEDEDDGEWEDSASESEEEDAKPPMFKRVDSRANLTTRRSMLTTLMHEADRASALQGMAAQLQSSKSQPQLPTCILFVVQENERNIFDQLALSRQLTKVHKIPVFRLLSSEILDHTYIPSSNPSRPLIYRPPYAEEIHFEVTTVYLRSFYTPTDYNSNRD